MLNKIINKIFQNTAIFDYFRRFVHSNYKKEKNILTKELNLNKSTLDFGCGIGQYSTLFKNYLGIDIEEDNIKYAKKNYNRKFLKIESLKDIKNKRFDQIFTIMTFHHITSNETKEIFNDFHKILKKNGKVVIIDHVDVKSQSNLLGKFMLSMDRGKYPKNIKILQDLFGNKFNIKKEYYYRTGPYRDYVLSLTKNDEKLV